MELFIENHKKIISLILSLLVIFLITFHFTDTPNVWGDEGVFTNVAETFANHGKFAMQAGPNDYYPLGYFLSTNYPVILPVAMSLSVFGNGILQARLPMIIYMFLLVIVFYLYTKKRYGFYPAILSVLMLISFSPFYGNGRPVQGEVPGLFFFILGCIFLQYLEDSNFFSRKFALLSGLFLGLSASTKTLYLILLSLSLLIATILWFKKINNKKIILITIVSFMFPIIIWLGINFPTTTSVSRVISTYFNLALNQSSSMSVWKTVFLNSLRFFTETTPMLVSLLLVITLVNFYLRFVRKANYSVITLSEVVILFFIIFNLLAYLPGIGWYRYFFPANTLLYLFFPTAILGLTNLIENKVFKNLVLIIPLLLVVFQFYHLVFLSDTSFVSKRTRNNLLSEKLSEISPEKSFLFYDTIEAIVFFKGVNYYQYSTIENFYTLGDINIFKNTDLKFDYILTSNTEINPQYISCYEKELVGKYSLYKNKDNCISKPI